MKLQSDIKKLSYFLFPLLLHSFIGSIFAVTTENETTQPTQDEVKPPKELNPKPVYIEDLIDLIETDREFITTPQDNQVNYFIGFGMSYLPALQHPFETTNISARESFFSLPFQVSVDAVYQPFEGNIQAGLSPIRIFKIKDQPQPFYFYKQRISGKSGFFIIGEAASQPVITHFGLKSTSSSYINGVFESRFNSFSPYIGLTFQIKQDSFLELYLDTSVIYTQYKYVTSASSESPKLVNFSYSSATVNYKIYHSESLISKFTLESEIVHINWGGWKNLTTFDTLISNSVIYSVGRIF